jgi:hypothetical protein
MCKNPPPQSTFASESLGCKLILLPHCEDALTAYYSQIRQAVNTLFYSSSRVSLAQNSGAVKSGEDC